MKRMELFISLMISLGSPFMGMLMGMMHQKIFAGIGLFYVLMLNLLSSIKATKEDYVNVSELLVAISIAIPMASFSLGRLDNHLLSPVLKILVMFFFTLINCMFLFMPLYDYYVNEIRWKFTKQ